MPIFVGTARSTRRGPELLVRDSFGRTDNAASLGRADTGRPWAAVAGTWGVAAGRAYAATDADADTATIDVGACDYDADIITRGTIISGSDFSIPQLLVRYIDTSNWLRVFMNGVTVRLAKNDATVQTTLVQATTTVTDNRDFRLGVRARGASLTILVDGVTRLVYTLTGSETKFLTPTKIGLRLRKSGAPATAARWDDLEVRAA